MAFETDESVLFIEVSLIHRCPDREREIQLHDIIIAVTFLRDYCCHVNMSIFGILGAFLSSCE